MKRFGVFFGAVALVLGGVALSPAPAGAAGGATVSLVGSTVVFDGGDGADAFTTWFEGTNVIVYNASSGASLGYGSGCTRYKTGGAASYTIPQGVQCPASRVGGYRFNGNGGNDSTCQAVVTVVNVVKPSCALVGGNLDVYGGSGNDILTAYGYADGGEGNDTIYEKRSGTQVRGGNGNDTLKSAGLGCTHYVTMYGGSGNDKLVDGGNGTLYGEAGNDLIRGGQCHDNVFGGEGDDTLEGGTWSDTLTGGPGRDVFKGIEASDTIWANDWQADGLIDCGGSGDTAHVDKLDKIIKNCEGVVVH